MGALAIVGQTMEVGHQFQTGLFCALQRRAAIFVQQRFAILQEPGDTLIEIGAVALPDGRAWALKTDDGAPRVRPVLMAEALRRSGVLDEAGVDADAVRSTGRLELLGGGVPCHEPQSLRATDSHASPRLSGERPRSVS